MSTVAELIVWIGADFSGLSSGFTAVSKELDRMAAGFKKTAANFEKIGIAMAAAGGAIAAGLGSAVKVAADFEQQMSKVQALSGGTKEDFNTLRDAAIDLGSKTVFSASQAAEGMQNFAAAGFETKEILDAMPGLLSAAAAGGMGLSETSDLMVTSLKSFGLEAKQSGHVADVLAKAANESAISMGDIAYSMKYAAPVAHAAGMSIEEVSSALIIMGNAGIKGETAGTTLRGALSSIVNPGNQARAVIEQLGLVFTDTAGHILPMSGIIQEVKNKTEGLTEAQRLGAIAGLFGRTSVAGMLTLMEAGPATIDKYTEALEKSTGSSEAMAATMTDNLKGSLEQLSGAFESAQISIGTALTPAIRAIADALAVLVSSFNALPTSMKESIASTAAVAAGVLLLGAAVAMLVAYWPAMLGGLSAIAGAFAAITSPIGMLIVGFGALVAAIGYWIATNQQAYATFSAVWTSITNFFQQAIDLIGTIWDTFFSAYGAKWAGWGGDLVTDAKAFLLAIAHAFEWGLNLAADTMALVSAVLKGDWGTALDALAAMSVDFQMLTGQTFEELKNSVGAIWQDFKDMLVLIWEGAMTALGIAFNLLWQDLKNTASGIADTIVSVFKGAINIVISAINALIGVWNSLQFNVPLIDMGPLGQWGGYSVGVPTIAPIPALADGGVISSAGAALVGEQGPELLNLPRGASVTPLPAMAGAGGGGATYNTYITVQGSVVGEAEIWRIARRGGIAHRRSNLAGDLS